MPSAKQIGDWVRQVFDEESYHYEQSEDENSISIIFPVEGKLEQSTTILSFRDDLLITNTYVEADAEEDCRQQAAEFLLRANRGLVHGGFELDYDNGEIRYHRALDCKDRTDLSKNLILIQIISNLNALDKYGDALLGVLIGLKSPKEAIQEVENAGL